MMLVENAFDTGEVVLNYAEGPDNGSPLLFIHGALGRWEDFAHYFPVFTELYHVYAIDSRGRGRSGRTPGSYQLKHMIGDVTSFIDRRVGEPTAIIGHSEGGWIATWAAHLSPGNVSALVILDSPITLGSFIAGWKEGAMKEWTSKARKILGRPIEVVTETLNELDPSMPTEAIRHSAMSYSLADPPYLDLWSQGRLEEYFEGYAPWEFLGDLGCPVMLVQADPGAGGLLPHSDVEKALKMSPRFEHILVEGVGHNLGMNPGEPPIDVEPILRFLESP